jgi:hypothetical protein
MEVLKHDREDSQAIGIKEEVLNCHALRKRLANDTRAFLQSLKLLSWLRNNVLWKSGRKIPPLDTMHHFDPGYITHFISSSFISYVGIHLQKYQK